MGRVAAGFLGGIGESLIVAGAVFSMVSASNASILAASSIGSLMGRQGQAPRPFSRIHREYGTPFWSVTSATATIVVLIVAFIAIFPEEGGLGGLVGLNLGLTALTGFATLNLLLPLAVVNVALIFSRRRYPDIERGFSVPGVPVVPVVGILANLALIYNLPVDGVITGLVLTIALVVAYLVWGGAPETEELFREITPEAPPPGGQLGGAEAEDVDPDRFRILVPVARPDRAARYVRLAAALGRISESDPIVHVLNVTQVPDQTPWETVQDTAQTRTERVQEALATEDLGVEYIVKGHTCRDVGFDITQTARNAGANLILMGYPERHQDVGETVERKAPCDVFFADRRVTDDDLGVVNIGAGGGPHHRSLLPIVDALGRQGSEIHMINVTAGERGTPETPGTTLAELTGVEQTQVHNVTAESVAVGLVDAAVQNGGVLIVGAARNRWFGQGLFGATPDEVVALSEDAGVPVLIHVSEIGVGGRLSERLFPVVRYVRKWFGQSGAAGRGEPEWE